MEQVTLRAQYTNTIWHSKVDDTVIIGAVALDDHGNETDKIVIVGNDLPEKKGATYRFDGNWERSKYGPQFRATGFVQSVGNNPKEIIAYLSSLQGCGKMTATKIYDVFGEHTYDTLDKNWELIAKIKGISRKKAELLHESWLEGKGVSDIYKELSKYGVTPSLAVKIADSFPGDALDRIKHDVYEITTVKGFSFKMADDYAYDTYGILFFPEGESRIRCAARQVLIDTELNGSLGMRPRDFMEALMSILCRHDNGLLFPVNEKVVEQVVLDLSSDTFGGITITDGKTGPVYVYRTVTRNAERAVALAISSLVYKRPTDDIDSLIVDAFVQEGLFPDPAQIEAVKTVFSNNLTIITGAPGTGKTTVIKVIQAVQEKIRPCFTAYLAPTGRAARRLSESVGHSANTIHSRLRIFEADENSNTDTRITEGLVVIDEASMIDIWVAKALFRSIDRKSRVVIVGDPAQLQSVGAGAVFRDMINSDIIPVARLTRIFRQHEGSAILENAQRIEKGDTDIQEGYDFKIIETANIYKEMTIAFLEDARKYGLEQVVCLMPTKDDVAEMNKRIQEIINPAEEGREEITYRKQIFRRGDLVMELENNEEVSNGDIGIITAIEEESKTVTALFYGTTEIVYTRDQLERIVLAYSMTVHKAQGSEYKSVLTGLQDFNNHMKIRSIPYTAITRAKEICKFYGSYQALQTAVLIDDKQRRQTLLSQDIRTIK